MPAPARLLVNIDVDDLALGEAFYTAVFGLKPARRFGDGGVELLGLEAPIYLLVKPADKAITAGSSLTRNYRRHWTPVHLDIAVTDIEEASRRARAAGAVQEGETRTHAWGSIALFADPFGHGFCLIQFSEQGYDTVTH